MFEQSVALISWILVSLNLSNSFFFFFFFKSATLFSIGGISWFSVDREVQSFGKKSSYDVKGNELDLFSSVFLVTDL